MNSLLTMILLLASIASAPPENAVVVVVQGLKNSDGTVMVGLFNNEEDFPERPVAGKVATINSGTATVTFTGLKAGNYAISAIHDENNNEKLDTNAIGIPKEGFAFGNNAMGMFGPPSFKKSSISVGAGQVKQTLRIRYF